LKLLEGTVNVCGTLTKFVVKHLVYRRGAFDERKRTKVESPVGYSSKK
jgi:hypothetical protein